MATSSAPELPSPEPGGASERVVSAHGPTGSRRRPAWSKASGPVAESSAPSGSVYPRAEILGGEPETRPAEPNPRVSEVADRRRHDGASLPGRKRRHVGPAAGEIEPHRRRRAEDSTHGATRQSCTVGSSPLRSMVTPRTRRFMP